MNDLITESGYADVKLTAHGGEDFSNKMGDYVDSYDILYKEIIECSREINDKSSELANLFLKLHESLLRMSSLQ